VANTIVQKQCLPVYARKKKREYNEKEKIQRPETNVSLNRRKQNGMRGAPYQKKNEL